LAEEQSGNLFGGNLESLRKALGGTANTAIGLGGALLTGQQNLTAYSGALSKNTDAFGKLGGMVGKVVDGLANFAEASLAEYQALTGLGATFNKEVKDIKVAAAELGLSVEDMTGFLRKNSESLRAFGGTTDQAIANFKSLSTTVLDSRELGTELRRLGFTTKDINENLALYGEITDANARTDRLSVQEQAASAKELMVELDGLAKLTGKNRQELADEMRARRRQGDVNAFLMGKSAEEQQAFMTQLTTMQETMGQDAADAFVDIALRGAPTTEATRGAMLAMGSGADELYNAAAQFNSGDIGRFQESMAAARGAALDYQDTEEFRNTAILGGVSSISNAFADASGAAYDYKNAIDSTKDAGQTAAQAEAEMRNQIQEQQVHQMEQVTGIFDRTIDMQENLREVSTAVMENTIGKIEDVAIGALDRISASMPSAGEIAAGINQGVDALFDIAGFEDAKDTSRENMNRNNNLLEGINTTLGQNGEDVVAATQTAADNTAASIAEEGEQTSQRITTAEERLAEANARVAELTSQGFTAMDPPMQAAREAAERAAQGVETLRQNQAHTNAALERFRESQQGGRRFSGGFAEGGSIPQGGYGLVGEAGPEFISGPANVMSAKTSMGVMQTLMKSIRSLDNNVQEVQSNVANSISTSSAAQSQSMNDDKLDTMISLLGQLITVENMAVGTQRKTMKATKGLTGNMLRGV